MNLDLVDITIGKLKNAKWRKEKFSEVKKLNISVNLAALDEAKTDVEYYSEVLTISKNNARFIKKCERWLELLKTDGINSKCMVANDIQALLKEIDK